MESTKQKTEKTSDVRTSEHATRYFIIGIVLTIFNYGTYTLLNLIFLGVKITDMINDSDNQFLWLTTLVSSALTTILAYVLHSKITWKERPITKHSIIRFFIWNALLTFFINPGLTQLFSLFTPLYEFAYNIIAAIHIPISYEFTLTTGAFVLTAIITMILNFLFYDKFVFGKSKQYRS